MTNSKKDQPVYEEMRSLAPYFLVLSGVFLAFSAALCLAMGGKYDLPLGAVYGTVIAALNFLLLGKSAQAAVMKSDPRSAKSYMKVSYFLRYIGLFGLLTAAAFIPFLNLITAMVPLFFVKLAIIIREIISARAERSARSEESKEE